jgi:CRP-like cAMP-binding protein
MKTQSGDLVAMLRRVPLLAKLRDKDVERLSRSLTERTFPAGASIVEQGKGASGFWIILDGTATVEVGGERRNDLGPGDWVGEIALLDSGTRTATVLASTDVRAAGMTAWEFKPFVLDHPEVAWELLVTLAGRVREAYAH